MDSILLGVLNLLKKIILSFTLERTFVSSIFFLVVPENMMNGNQDLWYCGSLKKYNMIKGVLERHLWICMDFQQHFEANYRIVLHNTRSTSETAVVTKPFSWKSQKRSNHPPDDRQGTPPSQASSALQTQVASTLIAKIRANRRGDRAPIARSWHFNKIRDSKYTDRQQIFVFCFSL